MVAVNPQPTGGASQSLITPREIRWLIILLIWCVLIAGAITAPLALSLFRPPRENLADEIQLRGDDVGSRSWPSPTPHDVAWPAPDSWNATREFGFRHFRARAAGANPDGNAFSMEVHQYGFPLPIVESVRMWWDWSDPALKGPEPTPALRLLWPGLLLNPILVGAGAYLLVMLPIVAFILGRRLARRAAGRCVFCAYPIGQSPVCTECGRDLGGAAGPKTVAPAR